MINYLLRNEYEEWLSNHVKNVSKYSTKVAIKDIGQYTYPDEIATFLEKGLVTYAYTLLDELLSKMYQDKSTHAYWQKYHDYIHSIKTEVPLCINGLVPDNILDTIIKRMNSTNVKKIDGMDTLIVSLGEEKILKLAIESCYFFSDEIATERHQKIVGYICGVNGPIPESSEPARQDEYLNPNSTVKGSGLPSRFVKTNVKAAQASTSQLYFNTNNNIYTRIKTFPDGNGNLKVEAIMKKYTGYKAGTNFQNYVISHIWGNATDPRYFTNFWNIVLVPAWVNHLLDKNGVKESFSSKLKANIMTICKKMYFDLNNKDWRIMDTKNAPVIINSSDKARKGTKFKISVINKKSKYCCGSIFSKTITI